MCMRVAVLGARGLIGGAVVRRAILAGHHVRAIVRPNGGAAGFPAGTEVIAADLRSRESVVDAVRRMEVVVHAASVPYPEWPRVVPLLADNAFAAAAATGATLVFPGNVYVYGRPRSRFVTEDHPQEPHTVKGRVRLAVERRLLQAHQDGRVDLVLPRYPDVYGPGGMHDDVRPVFEGALTGRPCRWPLDADALHEFILNDDAAEAMLKLLGTPKRTAGRSTSQVLVRLPQGTSFDSSTGPPGRASPPFGSSGAGCTAWSGSSTRWRAPRTRWHISSKIRFSWMERCIGRSREAGLPRRPTRTVCRGPWS